MLDRSDILVLSSESHPVHRRASDDQADSAIEDAVTHHMNLTFVGGWAK